MEIKKESNRNQTEPQEIKRGRGGARSGAGRPKRGPTLPVSQVEDHTADRAAYDARLAGGESSRKVEPSAITQRVEPETRSMVLDCGTVPQDHDPTGGCCWRRVTGVELIEVKGTVSVRWSPVKVDGTPGPRCQLSLDEWQASGGGIPVENPVLRSGYVAYRLRLSDGTVSAQIIRQPVREYAKMMNLPVPLPTHLTPLERPPLCPPSLVMPERTKADDVRENVRLFGWSFPTAKDDDDLIEQYETHLATRTEHEMAEARRHADMIEHREERDRLRKVGNFNRLMDEGA